MTKEKRRRRAWKLPPRAILQWWDIHSWAGIVGGLILYIMFVAGATTLFHEPLEVWEEPIHQRAAPAHRALEPLLAQVYRQLRAGEDPAQPPEPAEATAAKSSTATTATKATKATTAAVPTVGAFWFFPPHAGRGEAATAYQDSHGEWHTAFVDRDSGELLEQRERLAHFLYGLHYLWHDLTGQWLYLVAGVLAVVFLLVVCTGVLVHLRNFKRQFHQFRPRKSRHALWADLHKVLGVLGLPFQMMYAYTGALLVLAPVVAQLFAGPLFGGDDQRATATIVGASYEDAATSGEWLRTAAPMTRGLAAEGTIGLPLDELMALAMLEAPKLEPDAVQIVHPGYSHGYVEISGYDSAKIPHGRTVVILRAATGEELTPARSSSAEAARRWVRGLHVAHFGGFTTRVLLFLLTLAGCATIMSGNALWLVRREERSASRSNRILAKLTAGVGAGLWVAIGALFVASRLLPWTLEGRGGIEEGLFFAVLIACIGWALLARRHAHTWWRQLAVAAVLLAATPLLAALHSDAGMFGGLHVPDPGAPPSHGSMAEVIGVDVALWLMALVLACCAAWLRGVARRLDATTTATATAGDATASSAEARP